LIILYFLLHPDQPDGDILDHSLQPAGQLQAVSHYKSFLLNNHPEKATFLEYGKPQNILLKEIFLAVK
jgi:hypothetical protein